MSLEHGGEFMSGTNPYACTIDRIDNDKGYLKNNIQLVICAHNLWRNNLPLTEYKKLLGQING